MDDGSGVPSNVLKVLARLEGVKRTSPTQWQAFCKVHENPPDGHKRSLSIGVKADGTVCLYCHGGCETSDVLRAIGLGFGDLSPPDRTCPGRGRGGRIEATYDYRDADGNLLFQVVRYEPKDFRQRRPHGKGWVWDLKGVLPVLYRLPELLAADRATWVFVPEGEKDVDNLRGIVLVATTNPGGKGKWKHLSDDSALHGRRVAIIPDNDKDGGGMRHAQDVAARLHGKAAEVRIVRLSGEHKDVSEWLDSLDGREPQDLAAALVRMAEAAPAWTPKANARVVVDPFQPFPLDALPDPVRGFVSAGAKAIGCDPSYLALPTLSALASAIGNTRRIELKRGWTEPAIVWTAIVGESGTTKSPALELAMRPIRKRQHEAMKEHAEATDRYREELLRYERDVGHWRRGKDVGDPPPRPEEPVADRCWCDDTTVEALAVLLLNQPRGLLMVRDELSGWLASFDRYAHGKGGDVAKWLEMFGGRSMIVDRKTAGTLYVPRAAVSVAGGIQPDILRRAFRREHRENGLAARMLLACPPRRPKRWTEADIAPESEAALEHVFGRLYGLQPDLDRNGNSCPVVISLTAEGKQAWIDFYNAHAEEQAELTGDLSAAWSKLEGYAARLALVVHFVRWATGDRTLADPEAVDEGSIAAGVALSRWFKGEARRVYAMLAESEDDRQRRQLVELIRRKGGSTTARDLMRSSRQYQTSADAEAALGGLAEAGLGRWEDAPTTARGGRPTRRLRLVDGVDVDKTPSEPGEKVGCVNVNAVSRPEQTQPRDRAARLIRRARQAGNQEGAIALRDAWRERVAVSEVEGGLPGGEAEEVAEKELEALAQSISIG